MIAVPGCEGALGAAAPGGGRRGHHRAGSGVTRAVDADTVQKLSDDLARELAKRTGAALERLTLERANNQVRLVRSPFPPESEDARSDRPPA